MTGTATLSRRSLLVAAAAAGGGLSLGFGIPAGPARASQVSPGVLKLVIHEGRNRQVRRMCEAIGHPVVRLVRTRIGPLADRSLKPGAWRPLTTDEIRALETASVTPRAR